MKRDAFTLIELLVVIAIIAVLSVVVVLSLNPAELLRQSRDANRLSDLSTLNSALALYTTDQAGVSSFSLGNASSVYVSLPDSSSTCGTWSLPTLPAGYTYNCVTATSSKNIASTGWIPVNFSNISGGAPFSNLPLDGVNQSSTGLYYTYYSNGSQFMVTAIPESQKQKTALGAKPFVPNLPEVLANGSNLGISPLFNTSGLVGYWPMDEGTGTVAYDQSGNGGNGTFTAGPAWAAGRIGPGAIQLPGNTSYVTFATPSAVQPSTAITVALWGNIINSSAANRFLNNNWIYYPGTWLLFMYSTNSLYWGITGPGTTTQNNAICASVITTNTWQFVAGTYDGNTVRAYVNGVQCAATSFVGQSLFRGGAFDNVMSSVSSSDITDDIRVYNRALSPAEIQALYNAEK